MKLLLLFLALSFFALGCKKGERAQRDLDSLRSKAYAQKAAGDLALAIESYQRLIELDSLHATAYRLELLAIYERVGNFRATLPLLDSLSRIDSLQSLYAKRLLFLSLLGETDALKKDLRRKFPLTPYDELLLADLYLKEKDYDRAHYHLALLSHSENTLVAIDALGKLAMLFDGYRQNGVDSSAFFLRKLSDLLTERLGAELPLEMRFQLLYRSAHIFSDFSDFTVSADSLYSEALKCLAQPVWQGGNREALAAWITLERNCIGTPQSQPIEQALLTFRTKEHRLGEAFATLLLGKCSDYAPSRRMDLLVKSLELFESLAYPELPYNIDAQLDDAVNDLLALLLEQGRLLEAFEISERLKMQKQRFSPKPIFKPSHAFQELKELQGDVIGLFVAKDSLAFLADDAERIERAALFAETLAKKQGEFYQKLIEYQLLMPAQAEQLSPKPLTLFETQRLLQPDEALVQLLFGEAKSYMLVITESKTHILFLSLTYTEIRRAFKQLRFELLNGLPIDSSDVMRNETRNALSASIFTPLLPLISERTRVYVMSNLPCPIHMLGTKSLLAETHQISYLTSAKQLQLAKFASQLGSPRLLSLDEIDTIPFDIFESPQEALLEWGRLDDVTKSVCTTLSRPIAESYQRFARSQSVQNRYTWINFSCYGK
ncbi:MAG: tetratricopeptide repeat protein [Chlorobiales bacterium]